MTLSPVRSQLLQSTPRIKHGFFTRQGGVSEGLYASLNISYSPGDEPANIGENRKRVAAWFEVPEPRLITLKQERKDRVLIHTSAPEDLSTLPAADAHVTSLPGLILGILTADCVPVMLTDTKHAIIGAAHAGWQGVHLGIVEKTIAAMETLGANREQLIAATGPAIAQANYEVGPEFYQRFIDLSADYKAFFSPPDATNHYRFDLKGAVAYQLRAAGIKTIDVIPNDTYAEATQFYSYRRSCHKGEGAYGNQLSAIMLGA